MNALYQRTGNGVVRRVQNKNSRAGIPAYADDSAEKQGVYCKTQIANSDLPCGGVWRRGLLVWAKIKFNGKK
jgi:hypothetical protein